jgi:hypothetical protein
LDETDRIRRFVKGLRPELKRTLIGIAPETLSAAMEIASRIEVEVSRLRGMGKMDKDPLTQKRSG